MATIQTQIDRFELLEWLINTKQDWIWEKIAQFRKDAESKTFLKPLTEEQYQEEILLGMQQIKAGKFVSHEDVVKESERWL